MIITNKVLSSIKLIILFIAAGLIILPIWMIFISSFRKSTNILTYPPKLWPDDGNMQNYINLFDPELYQFSRWFINSLIFAGGSTIMVILVCSMAGYAFAKKHFFGKQIIFSAILATLMIPQIVSLIPTFLIVDKLGLINTYHGLIVPTISSAFGVFLMTQFIQVIPSAIEESARMDGCGEYRVFFKIILPIATPSMGILAIFNFISVWSNLTWPLIATTDTKMKTLTVGIASMKYLGSNTSGEIMAASFLTFIPVLIVFLFAREKFIEGMTAGAVKG